MRKAFDFAAKLFRDTSGNVLPIAAVGMLVAVAIVGSAIDISRSYLVRSQMQAACDAGALAGRRTVTTEGFDKASKDAALAYFATNVRSANLKLGTVVPDFSSPDNGQTVVGTATTVLDTLVMRVFGRNTFDIRVTCSSSMGVGNSDVMMVLDTTGSMNTTLTGSQTRIQALRAAMKNFYGTIAAATASSNARVRYGFVPYSSSVNVGRLIMDRDRRYIVDKQTYQSRVWEASYGTPSSFTSWSRSNAADNYNTLAECNANKPPNSSDFEDADSGTQRKYEYSCQETRVCSFLIFNCRTVYIVNERYQSRSVTQGWSYQPQEYDTSVYKTFARATTPTGTNGANVSSVWAGCIEERQTVAQSAFSYSSILGISPAGALDLDLDGAPDVNRDATKWKPMWPEVAFLRWDSRSNYTTAKTSNGGAANSYCPVRAQLLAPMSQSAFNAYADSLQAEGSTYLDIGMIWGGRLLSPQGLWSSVVNEEPRNGGEVSRHLIFMTDGEMEPNYLIQQAWGIEYYDRRVTSDGYSNDAARHTSRFRAVCEAIKDKGIRVWVIAFTTSINSDLKACASDSSSYVANNSTELNAAFQEIAKQVGELRVVE
ncbi:pilus assembly protein TadG-related protein [Novosphingobium panipatense]|nr:pilus assembly protein TadG-related protein [Novosphingobium panipatense]